MSRPVVFDSRKSEFKKPYGAVPVGTVVRMRILVNRELLRDMSFGDEAEAENPAVSIAVEYDGEDMIRYPMRRVQLTQSVSREEYAEGETSCAGRGYEQDADLDTTGYCAFEGEFPVFDWGLYWYHFEIEKEDRIQVIGRNTENDEAALADPNNFSSWQLTVYDIASENGETKMRPEWIYGGIFYHIFVDRFYGEGERVELPGKTNREDWGGMPEYLPQDGEILNNDFFGGNLKGIQSKLDYLESLGVSCIYLSPIVEAYSNHKYDTADYTKVDPMFGTMKDFEELCWAAGERGIRVICDGVYAHTGSDSIYFNKYKHYGEGGAYNDPESPYRDWYIFNEDGTYECWWGIDTLPKLNKYSPSYRKFINGTEIAACEDGSGGVLSDAVRTAAAAVNDVMNSLPISRYWLAHGASGWRLDVVDELPADFLTDFVSAAKAERSDALIVGEVWEDASNKSAYDERKNYFRGDRLDSAMNYPLKDVIIRFVRRGDAQGLRLAFERQWENYPHHNVHALMNILGTHDSIRILTALAGPEIDFDTPREEQVKLTLNDEERRVGIDRLKLASLLQMTIPGVPCIYYGDEVEMEGYKDPFNRKCYPWGNENEELLAWYRKIAAIRRAHEVYREGEFETVYASGAVYAFRRYLGGAFPEGRVSELVTAVNAGETKEEFPLAGEWIDLISGAEYMDAVSIEPGQGLLLKRL